MSPNMESGNIRPDLNHEEENNDVDSGFGSGGSFGLTLRQQNDYAILQRNKEQLSASKFYYPELNSTSARRLLKNNSVGTFLLRDSSDSNYLFSLSVKTEQGVTSVRILYQSGLFLFDSDEKIRNRMPRFSSVMNLIEHHVHLSNVGANKSWRWEDSSGKKRIPVELKKPFRKNAPNLTHLCTIKINQVLHSHEDYGSFHLLIPHIDNSTVERLKEYPFRI